MTGLDQELVVLLDESGCSVGAAVKATVHGTDTPLHLAFSCYVFDPSDRLLLTQRAVSKPTWPGAWTNSFCGHPAPGEDMVEALVRRAEQELGVRLHDIVLALPAFRYRAAMDNGVQENEMCPVFMASTTDPVCAAPEEVEDFAWVDWATFRSEVLAGSRNVSPWCVEQVAQLPVAGRQAAAPGNWALLPPAVGGA